MSPRRLKVSEDQRQRLQDHTRLAPNWPFLPPLPPAARPYSETPNHRNGQSPCKSDLKSKKSRFVALGKDAAKTQSGPKHRSAMKSTSWPHSRGVSVPLIWWLFPCSTFIIPTYRALGSPESASQLTRGTLFKSPGFTECAKRGIEFARSSPPPFSFNHLPVLFPVAHL